MWLHPVARSPRTSSQPRSRRAGGRRRPSRSLARSSRDDGAVGAAFHDPRRVPAERADHLAWRADVEGSLAELEHDPQAVIEGPSACVGDEPVPVERSAAALKIQGHVVEPHQARQAARHDE